MEIKYINRATGAIEVEHPPAEGLMRFLYGNTFGRKMILPIAKQKFITKKYGEMMNSSNSTKRVQPFVDSLNIDMTESLKKIDQFQSFNDFFYRKLRPDARKIQNGLVSPGDGRVLAFEKVSQVNNFYIKGTEFTLKNFLRDDELANEYRNASMVILRLAPNDYHRYHFPYNGTPSKSKKMNGEYHSVSPIALDANFTEVFCENKKEICKLSTKREADILIIPVGATLVGSLNSTYEPDKLVEKGHEMGYFAFGGSSVVVLFDPNSFRLNSDLLQNTKNTMETYVKMGEQIGREI